MRELRYAERYRCTVLQVVREAIREMSESRIQPLINRGYRAIRAKYSGQVFAGRGLRLAAARLQPRPADLLATDATDVGRGFGHAGQRCAEDLLSGALVCVLLLLPQSVFGQFEMPDPRQMAGIPRPVDDLPNGTISVRLIRGQLSNNIANHPVELHAAGVGEIGTAMTDANGRAQFSGITAGTPVHAVATVDGERLESQEFPAPARGGIRLMLVATPQEGRTGNRDALPPASAPGAVYLAGNTRFVFELVDEALQVYYLLDVVNNASAPMNSQQPLIFDMPSGAQSTTILEGSSPQATARGSRVTVTGPFQPGRTSVQVAYQFPYSGGEVTLSQSLPVRLEQLAVVARKVGDVEIRSQQLSTRQETTVEGQTYITAGGPPIAAGGTISLELTGLPHHGTRPRNFALALVVAIIGIGVWATVATGSHDAAAARRSQLHARREQLFGQLVRLEEQRRAGRVEQPRYTSRRGDLIARLERVYGELDREGGDEGLAA